MRSASILAGRSMTVRGKGVRSRMTQTASNGSRRSTTAIGVREMVIEHG